ncbi:MAG: hypothetical protein ABEJ94_04595 [Halorientalis sp.]
MTVDDDPFAIPSRPERRYPRGGGVEYEGGTVFSLAPVPEREDAWLRGVVEDVIDGEGYIYGDWFDLPMPLYLVHDEATGDVFRVSVRNRRIRLHVLPATEPSGLRRFFDRLRERTEGVDWDLSRRVDG